MLYANTRRTIPTVRELVDHALGMAPAKPKTRGEPRVKAIPAKSEITALQFTVEYTSNPNFVIVRREKVGATTQKKPRKMHKSKLAAWYKSLERNGYEVRSAGQNRVEAVKEL